MKRDLELPRRTLQESFPVFQEKVHCLYLQEILQTGKVKSAVKNSSAYKPNQQIHHEKKQNKKKEKR